MKVTELETDMVGWPPVTKHYAVDGGGYLAVEVDDVEAGSQLLSHLAEPIVAALTAEETPEQIVNPMTWKQRPTHIFAVDEKGGAASLDVLHEFPAGTTHEQALQLAGYDVG
jgi:hypothetical protein